MSVKHTGMALNLKHSLPDQLNLVKLNHLTKRWLALHLMYLGLKLNKLSLYSQLLQFQVNNMYKIHWTIIVYFDFKSYLITCRGGKLKQKQKCKRKTG